MSEHEERKKVIEHIDKMIETLKHVRSLAINYTYPLEMADGFCDQALKLEDLIYKAQQKK
jgi:hypothetical protein